jgi:N-acetylneuraminate lyase
MTIIKKTSGLIAAPFAAFNADNSLNLAMIPAIVEKMVSDGLTGIYICGTNGEGPNLTTEERMLSAEAFVKAAAGRIMVFVHVGHPAIMEARRLAVHAQEIGADAISSVYAFYYKPNDIKNLVESMAEIASAAPGLPFYYYHIPALTNVSLDMVAFLELGRKLIPNLAGIKYTAATLHEYQACLNYDGGHFDILFGYDEMLLGALAVGAQGAIGSTYTYAAPLYLKIMEAFRSHDIDKARHLQMQSIEMVRCLVKYAPIPAQRAIMHMIGFDLGNCRLPLNPLSETEYAALKNALEGHGFFKAVEDCR